MPRRKKISDRRATSSSSSSSSASRKTKSNAGRGANFGTHGKSQRKETFWAAVSTAPPLLRQPALATITVLMTQNEIAIGQLTGSSFQHIEFGYSMALMNGGADYLAVFDSYRIKLVESVIRPMITVGSTGFTVPSVYSVIDYDDSNPLTTASGFREYSNCQITQYETVRRTFVPCVNIAAYDTGGAATGFTSHFAPWCDAASVNVEHHGFKVGMDGFATGTLAQTVMINHRFVVEWRCTR